MIPRVLSLTVTITLFAFWVSSARATPAKPIIVSTPTSTRAVAMEAVEFTREPFAARSSSFLYGLSGSTRIMVFVLNLSLQPGESASAVTADAEASGNQHYNLAVEYVVKVSGQEWLTAAVLRLDQNMGDIGDVLIELTYQGIKSNRVRIGIGHVGGGPADDPGAAPTPAPPYTLNGQITSGGVGLSGVAINLRGTSNADATSNDNGAFSFILTSAGDYSVTVSKKFFTLTPATVFFTSLANSQTVNFTAARSVFVVNGVARDDQGNGLSGISVRLESGAGGPPARTITTTEGGTFSFQDVPAGFDYTITPQNTSVFTFTSQSVAQFNGNLALTFTGTLRTYVISGFISDKYQRGVGAVSVTLSGAANASTTTDANGTYSFNNLFAGRNYTVTATKTNHFVSPVAQSINLLRDERMDFTAIRFYRISGKVSDGGGKGLYGILMSLSGPENLNLRTISDGSYSFAVTTSGNYVLTPSREQNFYQFSPAGSNLNITDHQSVNFTGNLAISSPTSVLEFDGTPMSVDYGLFWPEDTNVGHFFWEIWAMPGKDNNARYMLSDGYGGTHALLFGFNYGVSGHYDLMGNIWNGSTPVYFASDEGPSPGEWGHYAVGWDGQNIITYYDGVPVGKQPFAGPRVSTGIYNGATMLLIGGSNHQNFIGRMAQVRGYEENNPRENSPESSFAPQTVFSLDGQLVSYYFRPSGIVADLSYGYSGIQHNGWLRGMLDLYFDGCNGCPTPQFVLDPTAPDFANGTNPGSTSTLIDTPSPPPAGARVFDSFSRNNSTHILNSKGGLAMTETGASTWRSNIDPSQPQPFGILTGHAVLLVDAMALAWVPVPTATGDLDVSVTRTRGGFGSGSHTGLSFRVTDKNNFFFAFTSDDQVNPAGPKKLTIGYYQSGLRTIIAAGLTMPPDWTKLRAVTKGSGAISIYADGVLVYSTTQSFGALATGAGLFNCCPAMGLQNRWDNFTVLDAQ